ncbi:MAG: histidine phosphatase family protein [Bacteroidota bacterium]|nr:histidine phosphatase family protein [Bacteroidota bacterium]
MKTLYLVRHAKSSWNIDTISDIDRPLNERGYVDAYAMAKRIKKKVLPGILVSSPAIRAVSTALIFSRVFEKEASAIQLHPLLYDTGSKQYLQVIASIADEHSSAFIFGHNPVITETANLVGGTHLADMATAGIVGIEFDVMTWKKVHSALGRMIFYDFPKNGTD